MAPSYLFNPFFPTHPLKATLTYKTGFSKNAPVIFFIPVRFYLTKLMIMVMNIFGIKLK